MGGMEPLEQQLHDAVSDALSVGWSMSAIAKAAGVSRSGLRDWHTQYRPVSLNLATASKLAAWLGTSLKRPRIPKPPA